MTVTVLHPGAMGAAVASQAIAGGSKVQWVSAGRSAATARRAEKSGLVDAKALEESLRVSDVVLSICPPQSAEDVAHEVAELDVFRGIYIDANAISPVRVKRIAERILGNVEVLDGAIVGPPPAVNRECRLYLAGDAGITERVSSVFRDTSVAIRVAGSDVGAASALKAAFASYQKAARVLAGVSYALADFYNVSDALRVESETMTSEILSDPEYLPSVAARAWRWAPEMLEIAETLRAAGLPDDLAIAAESVLLRWEEDKDQRLPLADVLGHLRNSEN